MTTRRPQRYIRRTVALSPQKHWGLSDRLEQRIFSVDVVGERQAEPRYFSSGRRASGHFPSNCAVIEDRSIDRRAAATEAPISPSRSTRPYVRSYMTPHSDTMGLERAIAALGGIINDFWRMQWLTSC